MIPRVRPQPAPEQEAAPVEWEEVPVTDYDFFFTGGSSLMVTVFPGDAVEVVDGRVFITWATGASTLVHLDKVTYQEERPRTVKRPKAPTPSILEYLKSLP